VSIHVDFVNYQLNGTAREFVAMTVAYGITNPAWSFEHRIMNY
jgi:hypothetical protein